MNPGTERETVSQFTLDCPQPRRQRAQEEGFATHTMITMTADFYPLVLTSYVGSTHSESDHRAQFEQMGVLARRAMKEGTHHVAVALGGASMTAAERKFVGQLVDEFPPEYLARTAASYVVVSNPVVRGIITALRWVQPKLSHIEAVSSIDEAMTAAVASARKHRLPLEATAISGARRWLENEAKRQAQALAAGQ